MFRIKSAFEYVFSGIFSVLTAAVAGLIERDRRNTQRILDEVLNRVEELERLEVRVAFLEQELKHESEEEQNET